MMLGLGTMVNIPFPFQTFYFVLNKIDYTHTLNTVDQYVG